MTNRPGTVADVYGARRALMAYFQPPLVAAVVFALTFAAQVGSSARDPRVYLIVTFCLCVEMVVFACWSYPRGQLVRPRRFRLFTTRVYVVIALLALPAVAVTAAVGVARVMTHLGTAVAMLLVFSVWMAMWLAMITVPWRLDPYGIDIPRLRGVPDQPAVVDETIAPRQQLMVCAMLAGAERIDARLLTRSLRLSDQELGQLTAGLIGAHYIHTHPDGARRWVGLHPCRSGRLPSPPAGAAAARR